jgi:hypothetical protein
MIKHLNHVKLYYKHSNNKYKYNNSENFIDGSVQKSLRPVNPFAKSKVDI